MANKPETPDLALPGAILEYGQAIIESQGGIRHRTPANGPAGRAAVEDRLLPLVKANVVARRLLGIRLARQDDAERRARLRVFSLLAYRSLVQASCHAIVEISELAAAAMDTQSPPGEAVLAARNVIGKMAVQDLVVARKMDGCPFMRVHLPSKALDWLNGGKASLGFLTEDKIVRHLLPEGLDEDDEDDADVDPAAGPIPTVQELRARMSEKVIGLDKQVLSLSSLMAMHLARARMLRAGKDPGTGNIAVLTIGGSGCGKTWLMESAGKAAGCPFASISATSMTSEGYVGGKLDDLFKALVVKAKGNAKAARFGIGFVDEWDKKAARGTRDHAVVTSFIQQEVLVPMQGGEFQISGKRGMERPMTFNSVGTFFAFAGAFVGLAELIRKKTGKVSIGFSPTRRTRQMEYVLDSIASYGFLRQWTNRLTAVMFLPDPTFDSLEKAAAGPVMDSFNHLVGELGILLFPHAEAIRKIAAYALESRTFYRGIKAVWWSLAEQAVSSGERGTVPIGNAEVEAAISRITSGAAGGAGAGMPRPQEDSFDAGAGPDAESNVAE